MGNSNACPSLVTYNAAQQKQLYSALQKLPADSPLHNAMDDYANLREQVRACEDN